MLFGGYEHWMLRFWTLRKLDVTLLDALIATPTDRCTVHTAPKTVNVFFLCHSTASRLTPPAVADSTHRLPRFSLYPYPVGTWTPPARTIWWERDRVSDRTYKSLSTTEPGVDSDKNPTVRPVRRCPLQQHSFKQPSEARTK